MRTAEKRFSPSSGSWASKSAMVRFSCGWRSCGAISANGASTKRRWAKAGCGNVSSSPATMASPNKQQIEVQGAWAVEDTLAAVAPEFLFDSQQSVEQWQRFQFRLQRDYRIQEGRLIAISDGFGFIEGGARHHPTQPAETIVAAARISLPVTQIGAERDVGNRHRSGPRHTAGAIRCRMRIAFFGGTFDPPHCGHIAIARAAINRLATRPGFGRARWNPAAQGWFCSFQL